MRRVFSLVLCLVVLLSLSSCYDAKEVDDVVFVVAIGVDLGVDNRWRLSLQIPTMRSPGEDGGSKEGSSGGLETQYSVITVDGPTFFTAVNMLDTTLMRKLVFSHTKVIVFSEELAKSGKIGEYLAPLNRFMEIRRTAHIFVVKGTAMDFLNDTKPTVGSSISKGMELISAESKETGYFPAVHLQDFYLGIKSTTHQSIAGLAAISDFSEFNKEGEPWGRGYRTGGEYVAGELPRSGNNYQELFGTAVFDGDRMVGKLTGDETRLMLMARGEFNRGFFTFQDPVQQDLSISLDLTQGRRPKIRVTFDEEGKPHIYVKVWLDGEILAIQSMVSYEDEEYQKILESWVNNLFTRRLRETIEKCQSMNADVFKFGNYAARHFKTIQELENYNWNRHFRDAEVTTEVVLKIRRAGTQIKSSYISDSEGKSK